MGRTTIDVARLYEALDQARQERDWSWRQLAKEIGVSPSLLSRLANGFRPDVDSFATLVHWLGVPAEAFMSGEPTAPARQPHLVTEITALLRGRSDLSDAERAFLKDILQAAVRHTEAARR